jgi:PPK2 family polyphosphate:nucleotide phosphotransferase
VGKKPDLVAPYRVESGKGFRLRDYDPRDSGGLDLDKDAARKRLQEGVEELAEMQGRLYAQDQWALLLVFQAMDAAGKDSTIKHVFSGVNPQGCEVHPFKVPSEQELDHDFLWRAAIHLPERGHIGIFNRSYYEEVLVVRVHQELLERQRLPPKFAGKKIWARRFEEINAFEKHLWRNGTVVRKFFLNVSKEEQKKRFLERLDKPDKNWKFSERDVTERAFWDDYMGAYEEMIRETSTKNAPWHVVPADKKWFTQLVVSATIVETLAGLDVRYPALGPAERRRLARLRRALLKT